jgi:hypothetical protein
VVVAYVALFVALGGSSYAALRIGSKQIVNNGVRSADIRNNDVRGRDIRNDTITGADIRESSLGTVLRADSAGRADTASTANTANTANGLAGEYFAVVNPDGTLARGTANVSSQRSNTGQYYVSTDRNVASCFYVAALGGTPTADTSGQIAALLDPAFSTNAVFVVTRNTAGSTADKTFTLHIRC